MSLALWTIMLTCGTFQTPCHILSNYELERMVYRDQPSCNKQKFEMEKLFQREYEENGKPSSLKVYCVPVWRQE